MYSKLPFEEFFQLRTVCKDGIPIYNALSRSWNWRPNWTHYSDFAASKGMVFSLNDKPLVKSACVFYWQFKVLQNLALPPTRPNTSENMILGMTVADEKQGLFGSFSSFRVVVSRRDVDTQVYESGVWQTKTCRVPKPEMGGPLMASTGCADCKWPSLHQHRTQSGDFCVRFWKSQLELPSRSL